MATPSRSDSLVLETAELRFVAERQLSDGPDARVWRGCTSQGGSDVAAVLAVYRGERHVAAIAAAMGAAAAGGITVPDVLAASAATESPLGAAFLLCTEVDGGPPRISAHRSVAAQERLFRELGHLQAQIHAVPAPDAVPESPLQPSALPQRMCRLGLELPRGLTRSIAALADEQAPRQLLHGDFHPNNILYPTSGPVVIDWSFASSGDPLLDVARTLALPVIAEALMRPVGLLRGLLGKRLETFLDGYAEAAGDLDRRRLRHWQRVVLAAAAADAQANALSGAASRPAAKEQAIARHLLQACARLPQATSPKNADTRPASRRPSLRRKRVLFCLAGTTGDVLPGVTLAAGAASAGAEVTVATHAAFQGQVERLGLQFAAIPGSHDDLFGTSIGALLQSTRGRSLAHAAGTVALVRGMQPELFGALSSLAIADQQALVYTPLCSPLQYFADAEGVPGVALHYQTAFPTGRHGSPYVSAPTSSVPALNKFSFDLSLQLESLLIAPSARKEARLHGLQMPRQHGLLLGAWKRADLHLQAVSPWLCRSVPVSPFEEVRTGFLAVPGGAFQPIPDEVLAAHEGGRRLVYFGVGSLASGDNRKLAQRLHQAVGEREALLVTDRPVDDLLDGHVEAVSAAGVSHDQLFPLVSAAVIVGGAGTMSTALRAGTPMIILPHWFDQFAWQFLLTEDGLAAPGTPPLGRWNKKIAEGLDWAFLPETKERLSEAAAIVRAEESVAAGVAALASVLARPR